MEGEGGLYQQDSGSKSDVFLASPIGSLTSHQAILGAQMSWHSVTNTEFSCQQPKNHYLYVVFKEKTLEMV